MKILKVFDLPKVIGTLALVGPVYRVEIVATDRHGNLDTHVREFPHGRAAESWLMSMVTMHASGVAVKRGSGGRGAPVLHLDPPASGTAFRAPDAKARLRRQRPA